MLIKKSLLKQEKWKKQGNNLNIEKNLVIIEKYHFDSIFELKWFN